MLRRRGWLGGWLGVSHTCPVYLGVEKNDVLSDILQIIVLRYLHLRHVKPSVNRKWLMTDGLRDVQHKEHAADRPVSSVRALRRKQTAVVNEATAVTGYVWSRVSLFTRLD